MDHAEIKNKLSEYRDKELSASDRLAVETHLATCAECREWLKNWDSLSGRLFPKTPSRPTLDLTSSVLERIGIQESKPRRVPVGWLAPAIGIAAIIVLSVMPLRTLNHATQDFVPTDDVYNFLLTENGTETAAMDLMFA